MPSFTVQEIIRATRGALVWDLIDAAGERDLPKALVVLDHLLSRGENGIGLLFALTNKTRALLLLRDLLDRKIIQPPKFYNRESIARLAFRRFTIGFASKRY